ncbi:MAG TPA: YlxR family protein [Dehalococcoidia bacterium]|nr:YlxR family protein [Dehalococcoidia bacterium]
MKSTSSSSHRTRHVPQRTCLGCRQIKAKRELIRIVNTPGGNLEVDITGKKAGRGTYLCPILECWEAGLKGNRLDYALRTSFNQESRQQLMQYAEEHLRGAASGPGKKTG